MREYTFDYGKRTIIKNGIVYLSTDLVGRINIPASLIKPDLRDKKCTVELKDEKVILKYSKDQPDTEVMPGYSHDVDVAYKIKDLSDVTIQVTEFLWGDEYLNATIKLS